MPHSPCLPCQTQPRRAPPRPSCPEYAGNVVQRRSISWVDEKKLLEPRSDVKSFWDAYWWYMSDDKREFDHCRDVARAWLDRGAGHGLGCKATFDPYEGCDPTCGDWAVYEKLRDLITKERRECWNQALDAAIAMCFPRPRDSSAVANDIERVARRIATLKRDVK